MPSRFVEGRKDARLRLALQHLSKVDPVLAEAIRAFGPQGPRRGTRGFEGVASAIVYQQISGAAGDAIVRRLRERAGARSFPAAGWFSSTPDATLRACGLSPQKLSYLRDLSRRVVEGELDFGSLESIQDEEVVEKLTQVHGIGRWTAEMYLIFALRRPDVLPVDDLGVRKGAQHLYGFRSLPARGTVLRLGERWRPYRSYATHYLWRSLERPAWEGLRNAAKSLRGPSRRK